MSWTHMNNDRYDYLLKLKAHITAYYRLHSRFDIKAIDHFANFFETHSDMIKGLSFMKHEINRDEFTLADYEEIYNR